MSVVDFPESPKVRMVEFIGPFVEEWRVVSEGCTVPHLSAIVMKSGEISLCLDGRFMVVGSQAEAEKWVWFIAHAMAVAAGWSCHGPNSCAVNPYKVQISGIGAEPPHA